MKLASYAPQRILLIADTEEESALLELYAPCRVELSRDKTKLLFRYIEGAINDTLNVIREAKKVRTGVNMVRTRYDRVITFDIPIFSATEVTYHEAMEFSGLVVDLPTNYVAPRAKTRRTFKPVDVTPMSEVNQLVKQLNTLITANNLEVEVENNTIVVYRVVRSRVS